MCAGGQRNTPVALPPGKRLPIVQEGGWAPESVWTGAENLAPTEIRSPDHPVRRESLYRLSCLNTLICKAISVTRATIKDL
jgi:hypothetical protein